VDEVKDLSPLDKRELIDNINKGLTNEEKKQKDENLKEKIKDDIILNALKGNKELTPQERRILDDKIKDKIKKDLDNLKNNKQISPKEKKDLEEKLKK